MLTHHRDAIGDDSSAFARPKERLKKKLINPNSKKKPSKAEKLSNSPGMECAPASAATAAPMGIRPSTLLVRTNSSSDFSAVTMETATGIEMAAADSIALTKKLVSSEEARAAMRLLQQARRGAAVAPPATRLLLLVCLDAGLTALRARVVCIEVKEGERRERKRDGKGERGWKRTLIG